jgi:lactate dehydrogenase-like 2-hydroxyacid dehydrogenase
MSLTTNLSYFLTNTIVGSYRYMKIAFVHAERAFDEEFFKELKARLKGHELLSWELGKQVPATDFELAIVMGKFTREEMSAQPKLRLIQNAYAGCDGIDVDAASEMGIWGHLPLRVKQAALFRC